jgi:DNA-binding NtrC family response regulator
MRHAAEFGSQCAIVGDSDSIRQITRLVDRVADSECPVLIEGESGTGKELVAQWLHARGVRRAGPFIPVNCAGVGEALFESQFFGHVRGAFTGAEQTMLGLVRAADGGTLFLDEVGEIPFRMQAKLLRVLQEGEVLPVGTTRPICFDTRFIAATNRSLREEVEAGRFRRDLYYRLNIVRIFIPPLRERREDIAPLLEHFHRRFAERYGRPVIPVPRHVASQLEEYPWPGNVRELAAWVERLYVTGEGPDALLRALAAEEPTDAAARVEPFPARVMDLKEAEQWAIRQALKHSGRSLKEASRLLRIHRTTLYRKLKQYGMS